MRRASGAEISSRLEVKHGEVAIKIKSTEDD